MSYSKHASLAAIVFAFVLGVVALRASIAEVEEPPLEMTVFDVELENDPVADLLLSANRSPRVGDDFDRDDRVGLGTAADGTMWVDLGNWRIEDAAAHLSPTPGAQEPYLAVTDGPSGERLVRVGMETMGGGAGLLFGYRDASDYWALIATPAFASWQVWRVVDGEAGMVATLRLAAIDDGTEAAVHITEDHLDFLLDGRSYLRLATQLHPDATGAGLVALRDTEAAWDDFADRDGGTKVTVLPTSATALDNPSASTRSRHYPSLEGYRAVAAIAVAIYHFSGRYWFGDDGVVGRTVGRWGGLGVCIFFVLSGFVLYRPRVVAALDGRPKEPLGRYLTFRVLRIAPAYWLTLTFMVVALWNVNPYQMPGWDGSVPIRDHLRFFGFAQIYDQTTVIRGLGVAWTLGVELVFYLALPGIAWVLMRTSGDPEDLARFGRRQYLGLGALAAMGLGFRVLAFESNVPWITTTWPIAYLPWFAAGMALATASALRERGLVRRRGGTMIATQGRGLGVALVAFVVVAVAVEPQGPARTTTDIQLQFLLFIVVAVGMLAPLVLDPDARQGPVEGFLCSRPMQFLGTISFGLYLWHVIWIRVVARWAEQGIVPSAWPAQAVIVVVLTLSAALLTFEIAEAPVMRWKAALRQRRAGPRPEHAPPGS